MTQRHADPDLLDAAIAERHHAQPVTPPAPKDVRAAKRSVWDAKANVRDQLAMGKPLSAEDICRLTGQTPEQCAVALAELEGKGEVRRVEGGLWERTIAT